MFQVHRHTYTKITASGGTRFGRMKAISAAHTRSGLRRKLTLVGKWHEFFGSHEFANGRHSRQLNGHVKTFQID
jgi:hypothetical protein